MVNKKFKINRFIKGFTPLNRGSHSLVGNLTGVTLIEILIVLGLILVLAAVSVPFIGNWPLQTKITDAQTALVQDLRLVRAKSLAGVGGQDHGLKFLNDGYVMFQGDSYANRQPDYDLTVNLDKKASLAWQLAGVGQPDEVVFAQGTGLPSRLGQLILSSGTTQVTVGFNRLGLSCTPECANRCAGDDDGCDSTCTTSCSWQIVGSAGISGTTGAGNAGNLSSLAFNPSTNQPYLAFRDSSNANKATVKYYNGSAWVTLGSAGFTTYSIGSITLVFNPVTNLPYIAYKREQSNQQTTVMYYNGSSWVTLGSPYFANARNMLSMAFDPVNNQPYIAYTDYDVAQDITVKYYNGSSWVTFASAGIAGGTAYYPQIAFNQSTNQLYISYIKSGQIVSKYYNGSAWVALGTIGSASNFSFSFDYSTNRPYAVYGDMNASDKATAVYYNGSSMTTLGSAGFSAGEASYIKTAFNPDTNQLYMVYVNASTPTVMYYNGSAWVNFDSGAIPSATGTNTELVFNPSTYKPCVQYIDSAQANKITVTCWAP